MVRSATRGRPDNRRGGGRPGRSLSLPGLGGLLLLASLAAGLAWGYELLTDAGFLPVRVVHIEGDYRYLRRETLERAVAGLVSGGFFSVDVHEVGAAAARLPWVDKVSVRRVWPDGLRMHVVEEVPLARWGSDSLVNDRGEVFTPGEGAGPQGLPSLDGPEGSTPRVMAALRSMGRILEPLGLGINRLQLEARGGWNLEIDRGLRLRLGTGAVEQKLERFVRFYPRLLASREESPELVDLRYANGFSVHWTKAPVEVGPEGQEAAGSARPIGDRSEV